MIFNFISKSVGRVARLATVGIAALALASCGGGGGSAGTEANSTGKSTAASLQLQFSSTQISSTAATPVTITVTALDANNNAVPNVTIQLASDTGVITPAGTVTSTTGQVTATLSIGTNTTPRIIHVTAQGGGQTATGTVQVTGTTGTPTISLLFSSPTLASAGTTAGAVTVSALVQDSNNNALSGVPVSFSATSGVLTVASGSGTTNSSGLASATLNTAGNQTNRSITVTASGSGVTATATIQVTGTTLTASSAPSALTLGTMQKYTFTLQDSAGNNIANAPVTFKSAAGNTVVADSSDAGTSSAPLTNSNGVVVLDVTPTVGGQDTLTVTADGATATTSFSVTSQSLAMTLSDITTTPPTVLNVNPQPLSEYTSSSCIAINASYTVNGAGTAANAAVSTSRGALYTNPGCTTSFSGTTTFNSSGQMTPLYLKSLTAGTAVVTVSEVSGATTGPTQTGQVTFIAQLTSAYTPSITITTSTSLVAPNTNSANPTAQFATITATVRDGSPQNNLVQGVPVQFTLATDASGGNITPSVVVTQSSGQATAIYYPGPGTTAANGVDIQATIQSPYAPPKSTTYPANALLTVSGTPLFVTLGSGNQISAPTDTTFQQDWVVFVTDSNGNPVPNATVTGQLVAKYYTKGTYNSTSPWAILSSTQPTDGTTLGGTGTGPWCPNTDASNNGVWSPSNPIQIHYPNPYPTNPSLAGTDYPYVMPGIPGNVTTTGLTASNGYTTLEVTWPQDHSQWTYVTLTVTASVSGSQSTATTSYVLPILASDLTSNNPPPGFVSPYGVNQCGIAF